MNTLVRTSLQIGTAIQRRRKALGLTQGALGEKSGLRQATISQIERGENTRLESLLAVLAALDLELTIRKRTQTDSADLEELF